LCCKETGSIAAKIGNVFPPTLCIPVDKASFDENDLEIIELATEFYYCSEMMGAPRSTDSQERLPSVIDVSNIILFLVLQGIPF
jgi:hypothetical protein